jgi:CRP/FNR family transcriptional regulator
MFSETIEWRTRTVEPSFVSPPPIPPRLDSLFSRQPVEQFKADATVFREGDTATHVFDVMEGMLRIVKILTGGRRVITGFVYPGDILGVSLRSPNFGSAEALSPTKIRRLPRDQFSQGIKRYAELNVRLVQRLCEEMAAADDRIVLLARKTAEERVCSLLLMIERRLQQAGRCGPAIEVPMCRLDMADYLGLTKETVCRAMSRLADLGMIVTSGRHTVLILSRDKLARLAGDADCEGPSDPARRN